MKLSKKLVSLIFIACIAVKSCPSHASEPNDIYRKGAGLVGMGIGVIGLLNILQGKMVKGSQKIILGSTITLGSFCIDIISHWWHTKNLVQSPGFFDKLRGGARTIGLGDAKSESDRHEARFFNVGWKNLSDGLMAQGAAEMYHGFYHAVRGICRKGLYRPLVDSM